MGKRLKAYEVRADDFDGGGSVVITFATNNATARREGAAKLDLEWHDIDSCRRAPQFDQYAPGPVPPLVLIEHGWWFECGWCGAKVDADNEQEDDDGNLLPYEAPVAIGSTVYCCAAHAGMDLARKRGNAAAKNALCELVYTRWPEAQIIRVHVCGDRLDYKDPDQDGWLQGGWLTSAEFTLPGLKYPVTYHWGHPKVWVTQHDLDAFKEIYGPKQPTI